MRIGLIVVGLLVSLTGRPVVADEADSASASFVAIAAEVGPQLQAGTLLFSEGDCLAIRIYTASRYTHVAVVCIEDGQPFVYDSMNGVGVRRLSLTDYLAAESPNEVQIFQPHQPLSDEQERALAESLRGQLGRPYAIHHHLTGQRTDGLHCSEYATDALMSVGLITAERPPRVSPASLAQGITQADIYTAKETIRLEPPAPSSEPASNRCHQLWIETKQCTSRCCDKLTGWFLCR